MINSVLEDPNAVYEFDEKGNPIIPTDSQSLIRPEVPVKIPLITNRPERRQEAIDTGGGYIEANQKPISYTDSPEGRDVSPPAISLKSPVVTNQEEYRQAAVESGGAFIEKSGETTSYRKEPPKPTLDQQIQKLASLTPEEVTTLSGKKYGIDLSRSATEQAIEVVRQESPARFRREHGRDIGTATNAELKAHIDGNEKRQKDVAKVMEERQKLASEYAKKLSPDALKALQLEGHQLDNLKKKAELANPKEPTQKIARYMRKGDPERQVVPVNENDPNLENIIKVNKLEPWSKAEKPEYSPKQALTRLSAIDVAIARMKTSGTVDAGTAIQNPALAALLNTKDPEAIKQAVASLETEREYVQDFAPKGTAATTAPTVPTATTAPTAVMNPVKGTGKDKFGYTIGQSAEKGGSKYQYIGNDKWKKL